MFFAECACVDIDGGWSGTLKIITHYHTPNCPAQCLSYYCVYLWNNTGGLCVCPPAHLNRYKLIQNSTLNMIIVLY